MKTRVAAFIIGLTGLAPCFAQAGTTGSICGQIKDIQGKPVSGVLVRAQSSSQVSTTVSDDAGFYTFASLTPDVYTISFAKDKYSKSAFAGVSVFADNNLRINMRLDPAAIVVVCVDCFGFGLVKPGTTADVYTLAHRYFSTYPNQLMMQLRTMPVLATYGIPAVK